MKHKENASVELHCSTTTRKALAVQLGEAAGREVADLLQRMADRIEKLERTKVDVMPVVQADRAGRKSRRTP